jgi:predicted Fe-Mo cluster-binding NifX family protein
MKIALPTQDGKTVSAHFGRSPFFAIYHVENKEVLQKELRTNGGAHGEGECSHGAGGHSSCSHGENHGHCSHGHQEHHAGNHSHAGILAALRDVDIIIAGGMGQKMFAELTLQGKIVLMTDETGCEAAVQNFLDGTLSGGGRQHNCGCGH